MTDSVGKRNFLEVFNANFKPLVENDASLHRETRTKIVNAAREILSNDDKAEFYLIADRVQLPWADYDKVNIAFKKSYSAASFDQNFKETFTQKINEDEQLSQEQKSELRKAINNLKMSGNPAVDLKQFSQEIANKGLPEATALAFFNKMHKYITAEEQDKILKDAFIVYCKNDEKFNELQPHEQKTTLELLKILPLKVQDEVAYAETLPESGWFRPVLQGLYYRNYNNAKSLMATRQEAIKKFTPPLTPQENARQANDIFQAFFKAYFKQEILKTKDLDPSAKASIVNGVLPNLRLTGNKIQDESDFLQALAHYGIPPAGMKQFFSQVYDYVPQLYQ